MKRLFAILFASHKLRLNPEELHNSLEYYARTHRGVDRNPKEWAATTIVAPPHKLTPYQPMGPVSANEI